MPEHIKVDGKTKGHLHHYQLLAMIDGFDPKRGPYLKFIYKYLFIIL